MPKGFLVSIALLLSPALAFAALNTPNNCTPNRQAKVEVKVERLHWVHAQGNYKLKNDVVCTNTLDMGVLPDVAAGCIYPVLAKCNVVMDGTKHIITVSGLIYHNNDLGVPTKHFTAGYHLDRNHGNVTTGEAASSDVFTADLSLKKISVAVQSKLDGPAPGTVAQAFRDGLVVSVNYGDNDAP